MVRTNEHIMMWPHEHTFASLLLPILSAKHFLAIFSNSDRIYIHAYLAD